MMVRKRTGPERRPEPDRYARLMARGAGPAGTRRYADEDAALQRLLAHLQDGGERAELLGRPDRLGGHEPAVDAEVLFYGKTIAVEITRLTQAAREHVEIAELRRALQARLDPLARELRLGQVVISADFRPLPARREIAAALEQIGDQIAAAMQWLPSEPMGRTDFAVPVNVDFVRSLELVQFPAERHRVSWITGSEEWGGWVDPMADEFVEHLLVTKPRQTAGYDEAWIVVVDRSALVDADNLRHALRGRLGNVPPNWTRVYFLPSISGAVVGEISITQMREERP